MSNRIRVVTLVKRADVRLQPTPPETEREREVRLEGQRVRTSRWDVILDHARLYGRVS